ncbi:MAG: hypothetical protein JKY25_01770 [Robiginitomaculum sp.]|nr:hypothetical protein [Robiginitomaculum sp.]PHS36954.1 MAG: hypothetical protein COA91_11470 [Robiginitomaculum sp.]
MIKPAMFLGLFLSALSLNGCEFSTQATPQKCDFKFTVLGYDSQRIVVNDRSEIIYDAISAIPEKATEISAFSNFTIDIPTKLFFVVGEKYRYTLKVPDCTKLGIVLSKRDREAYLVHLDNYFFE